MTKAEIKSRCFVPYGAGGYRLYDDLSATEKKAFSNRLVKRIGEAFNRYASVHPEAISRMIEAG